MLDAVIEGCKQVVYWFINLFFELINPLIEPLFENFPTLTKTFGVGAEFISYANFFLPLDYGFTLLSALSTIKLTYIGIKLVIKIFIPGFG